MIRIDGNWEAFIEYVESGKAAQEWEDRHQKALRHVQETLIHIPSLHSSRLSNAEESTDNSSEGFSKTRLRIRAWLT